MVLFGYELRKNHNDFFPGCQVDISMESVMPLHGGPIDIGSVMV